MADKSKPLVSFCVPIFNKITHLASTIAAASAQTYGNVEIILSDNGSTDGSEAVAREAAARDARVRYVRLRHTLNVNESWRYCLSDAGGEFLKLQSADDTSLPPEFVSRMVEPLLADSGLDYSACAIKPIMRPASVSADGDASRDYHGAVAHLQRVVTRIEDRDERARVLFKATSRVNLAGTPYSMVFRRHCLPRRHWDKALSVWAWPGSYPDWDLALRLLLNYRGVFVEGVECDMYYDNENVAFRRSIDCRAEFMNGVAGAMMPITVLLDPEMAPLRAQADPSERASLLRDVSRRMDALAGLADEVVAFEDPRTTARVIPRLRDYIVAHKASTVGSAPRRLRQLRMCLVRHWLESGSAVVRDSYRDERGAAHRMLIECGLRADPLWESEGEALKEVRARLATLAGNRTVGCWLAWELLAPWGTSPWVNERSMPEWVRAELDGEGAMKT